MAVVHRVHFRHSEEEHDFDMLTRFNIKLTEVKINVTGSCAYFHEKPKPKTCKVLHFTQINFECVIRARS